jgi:acyl-CoA thioester hydrolase
MRNATSGLFTEAWSLKYFNLRHNRRGGILKPVPYEREYFAHFRLLPTRWMDNDCYGHVNNVVYYSWFDTALNTYLIEKGVLDPLSGAHIGYVVSSSCNYFSPIVYPQPVELGLAVSRLGRSSVEYTIGVFASGERLSAAWGKLVHVYVERATQQPVQALSTEFLNVLSDIQAKS